MSFRNANRVERHARAGKAPAACADRHSGFSATLSVLFLFALKSTLVASVAGKYVNFYIFLFLYI